MVDEKMVSDEEAREVQAMMITMTHKIATALNAASIPSDRGNAIALLFMAIMTLREAGLTRKEVSALCDGVLLNFEETAKDDTSGSFAPWGMEKPETKN